MSRLVAMLACAVLMAVGTVLLGWWTVPVVAGLWAIWRQPIDAGLAGILSWGGILAWQAWQGPVGVLAQRLAGIVPVPAVLLPWLTPLFAGLLAWSAAAVVGVLAPQAPVRRPYR
ncbi:MAG: hypothetical protein H6R40_879 [Gemmatimonadetes bacterium]|nr:hypothetical protein [Gemmatimonadota bacterium]